jgi:hypothetical protein
MKVQGTSGIGPAVSATPRRLYHGDIDLLHPHHRPKCALCFIAAGG